ncbi:MAG TPA: hypothetical protein DCY13_19785 [Verrucomicrobiales bacterium]|nr:hypothetical protein [Verrucomicrobiales bacterium]
MDRNVQRTVIFNLVVLLAAGLACLWTARLTGSLAGQTALWYFLFAILVGLVSWFQQRLQDREKNEQMEFDELARNKSASSLFNTDDAESFPARQSRIQFEKWFVPIFAALLVIGQGIVIWRQWQLLAAPRLIEQSLIGMAVYAVAFLALTIFGLYASRLAQHGNYGLLRPAAGMVLLNAYLSGLVAAGLFGVEIGGFRSLDLYLARLLVILLGIITVEMGITLVFEIYRPRIKGKGAQHALYESRVVGLLSRPDSLVTTAAHALDYQFGFKVSETWFYQFLQRSIAWIVLVQVGLLLASTAFVFIEPGEQGLRERLGREAGGVLGPGIHFKLPWPLEAIHTYRTSQVQSFVIGVVPDEDHEQPATPYATKVIQWTVSHNKEEYNMLVASGRQTDANDTAVPVNLLTVSIPVQFEIRDLKQWVYGHKDPAKLLEDIATREVVRYLVNVNLLDIMGEGRASAIRELTRRMQEGADAAKLGANILFVGLQDIHPPTAVAKSFQEVIGAQIGMQTNIIRAEAIRAEVAPRVAAETSRLLHEAEAYRASVTNEAAGRAGQFERQLIAYRESPRVYLERSYLDTFARGITNARIYVMAVTNTDQVINFNLEEKSRRDISDIMVPNR